MSINRGILGRTWLGVVVTAVSLIVGAGTVLADTEESHIGAVGGHSLRDFPTAPGVTCNYEDTGTQFVPFTLVSVRVRPPMMFARNVTSITDRQRVGWRFIVEKNSSFGPSGWTVIFRSGTQKTSASDVGAASFSAKTGRLTIPAEPAHYLVKIKMFWYRNGATEGKATHIVDYYRWRTPVDTQIVGPGKFCLDGLGN